MNKKTAIEIGMGVLKLKNNPLMTKDEVLKSILNITYSNTNPNRTELVNICITAQRLLEFLEPEEKISLPVSCAVFSEVKSPEFKDTKPRTLTPSGEIFVDDWEPS